MGQAPPESATAEAAGSYSRAYKSYLLTVLLLIFAANYLDRFTLSLLLQEIKVDLRLTDTQLGLLTGIAFSIFYASLGVPIARWADRGNRVTIISLTTALFSCAVALCSGVTNFVQLMMVRIMAAVGEAGCQPPAMSLITDHFSRDERPRAVARYVLGAPIAMIGGFFVAGWLNEAFGWRATFLMMSIPGLLLAVVARLTLREPRRSVRREASSPAAPRAESAAPPPILTVLADLWGNRTYRHLLLGMSIQAFFVVGVVQWQPTFFVRSFGMSTGELGTWMALVYAPAGIVGTWLGGELAARYAPGDERLQLTALAVAFVLLAFVKPAVYLMPSAQWAFLLLALVSFLAGMTNGPIFAAVQTIVPPAMRATSTALLLFFSNLIGQGLGPVAAGVLSDALQPTLGAQSLRYVLVILSPGYLWAGLHLWLAARHLKRTEQLAEAVAQASQPVAYRSQ